MIIEYPYSLVITYMQNNEKINIYLKLFAIVFQLALQNALRYFPSTCHHTLAPEFAQELREYGHIYMYRFRPDIEMRLVYYSFL